MDEEVVAGEEIADGADEEVAEVDADAAEASEPILEGSRTLKACGRSCTGHVRARRRLACLVASTR